MGTGLLGAEGTGVGRGGAVRGTAPGHRDRAALGAAIRGLADAPDFAAAAGLIGGCAAGLLGADRAIVVRIDGGDPVVASASGRGAPARGQAMLATGTLAAAMGLGRAQASSRAGIAEVAAPIVLRESVWGALLLSGPAVALPSHPAERLAPFADLLSLAAATDETRARLASLAGTDALTGLGNRRAFDDLLALEVGRARRYGDPLSLVLLDIDHFKTVNDRFGHQFGDAVLIEVGRRLVAVARRGEAIARIGGEEFAWLLPRTPGEGAEIVARRALAAIAGSAFGEAGRLTVSGGVCELADAGDGAEMMRLADLMLYRAKADGRDAVRRFTTAGAPSG